MSFRDCKYSIALGCCWLLMSTANVKAQSGKVTADTQVPVVKPTDSIIPIGVYAQPARVNILYGEKGAATCIQAVSTTYNGQLTTTPASLFVYALPGRLAGLYASQGSGWPAAPTTGITSPELLFSIPTASLVGTNSTTDNTEIGLLLRGQLPVTVIDGIQRDIFSLDPETIESVSVQKDALSTILLGQKSSRGLMLVTTKKPKQGPPQISLTAQTAWQSPLGLLDPLPAYQYAYLANEALINSGQAPAYTKEQFDGYRNHLDPYKYPDINWQDQVLNKNSLLSRYSLNITGGSPVARYLVNLNYTNQQGMFKEGGNNSYDTRLDLKRYLINTKIDVDLSKNFNVALQLFGRIQDGNQPGAGYMNIFKSMLSTPNNAYPVYNPNKSFGGSSSYTTNLYSQLANSGYILNNDKELMSSIDLSYKLDKWIPGLWVKGKANVSVLTAAMINRSKVTPVFKMNAEGTDTSYAQYGTITSQSNDFSITASGQFWFYQASLGYTRSFGEHNIEAVGLFDQLQTTYNFDLPSKYTNLAGKLSYNYAGKYMLEGALTYSGYDRYKPGNRFAVFYAGGIGWDMAKEPFISDNISWLNLFKWRANYGLTGNANIGYFTWRSAYHDRFLSYGWGVNNVGVNGVYELPLANPNAHAEKAHKFDAGIDIAILNNRLQLTADYYRDEYFDLMQVRGRSIALMGNSYPAENIGRNRYTGNEFSLSWNDKIQSLQYFISANGSFSNSKVLFMDEIGRRYAWNERTGQPVDATFGYVADGLIQTQDEAKTAASIAGYTLQPGDIKYRDLNGDGVIDQFDETNITGKKPLFFYGLSAGIQFKGFNISVLFQGVENRTVFLNSWETQFEFGALSRTGQLYNHHLGRWTPENAATATYPRLTYGYNSNNHIATTTYWRYSGNYIRLKNIDLGYTLPLKWINRLKLHEIRLFANAQNLFTHADVPYGDPEVFGPNYPIQRVINTGINIKL